MSESINAAEVDGDEFTPITTQEALDKIMGARIDGVKKKFADHGDLKAKAAKFDALEEASKTDSQRAIEEIAALKAELAGERDGRLREITGGPREHRCDKLLQVAVCEPIFKVHNLRNARHF